MKMNKKIVEALESFDELDIYVHAPEMIGKKVTVSARIAGPGVPLKVVDAAYSAIGDNFVFLLEARNKRSVGGVYWADPHQFTVVEV
jgi:hypothetical protein